MTTTISAMTKERRADLRLLLKHRRREMQEEVQSRVRHVRADGPADVLDDVENSDADAYEDIELTLIQMRGETLRRVDEALRQLDAGEYGDCCECDAEISHERLRALPFAIRCTACEERREQVRARARRFQEGRGGATLFLEMPGY